MGPGLALISLCTINFQILSLKSKAWCLRNILFRVDLRLRIWKFIVHSEIKAKPGQPSWPGLALISLCTINFQILSLKSTQKSMFLRHQALDLRLRIWKFIVHSEIKAKPGPM